MLLESFDKVKIGNLLSTISSIQTGYNQRQKLNGESFNIFSILKLERAENRTHSAFIRELLNPKGTHLMGSTFLSLFLETIGHKSFDSFSAFISDKEKYLGKISDDKTEGGRVELYLQDRKGNIITIENKIDAQEEDKQLLRYKNHKSSSNTVYYLTLHGADASSYSKADLKANEDYHLISYKHHIIKWLELCLKVEGISPFVFHGILQYQTVIRKITGTMNNEYQRELFEVILQNYEAANLIASNVNSAKVFLLSNVRNQIYESLKKSLSDDFIIDLGEDFLSPYAQIWLTTKKHTKTNIYLGLESFSPHLKNKRNVFVGWYTDDGFPKSHPILSSECLNNDYWIREKEVPEFEGYSVIFSDENLFLEILKSKSFENRLIQHISNFAIKYFSEQKVALNQYLDKTNR